MDAAEMSGRRTSQVTRRRAAEELAKEFEDAYAARPEDFREDNPRAPQEIDEHAARELELWIDNTRPLYRQWEAIVKNLWRHKAKGRYDSSRAADGFMYVVDAGAKDYTREFGNRSDHIFNKATRRKVAEDYAESFENNSRDETAYAPATMKNPRENNGGNRFSADDWPEFVLDGVIESAGLPKDTSSRLTPELKNALDQFEYELQIALEEIVEEYPPKHNQSLSAVWEAEAPYAAFATLNGDGVGISDGRWQHLWSDADLERVQQALKLRMGAAADITGGGWLNAAFEEAAYANAAKLEGLDGPELNPAPASGDRMTAIAARLASGLS